MKFLRPFNKTQNIELNKMSRHSEQVCKEIERTMNQKFLSPFDQCMGIWQTFKKGIFGKELKEEFPEEYQIVFTIFKESGMDNVQMCTLQFLNSFIKNGKLHTLINNHSLLEYTIGQACKFDTSMVILNSIEHLHKDEKTMFLEKALLKHNETFDYTSSLFIGFDVPMHIECKRCNSKLFQTPNSHLTAQYPCVSCAIHIESWSPKTDNEKKTENWAHVFNGLYISDIFGAQNVGWIQNSRFTGIIDLSNSPAQVKFAKQIQVLRIPIDDNSHSNIHVYFRKCYEFINNHLEHGSEYKITNSVNSGKRVMPGKVLVFCRAGMSRSATIVIYYLMKAFSLTVEDAISFLKKKRHQIQPNNGFIKQLKDAEVKDREEIETNPLTPIPITKGVD
jgi:Dual specificity phosphatase, catalytic domain